MRAILLSRANHEDKDGDEQLKVVDVATPTPRAGEVLIEVAFGGCNYADTMMRDGSYPHPKGYPLVAGLEVAGRVAAVGDGVSSLAVGDRVAAFCEDAGGFADYCVAPAMCCVPLPDAIGFDVGAAVPIQVLTAWHLLHTVSTTKPGDFVLIHAIGGGVGLQLTQLAVRAGARVIGTVGTPGKERRPQEFGAERVFNRSDTDFAAEVEAYVGPSAVDKALDSTGATILDRTFPLMRKLGHVVSYGEAEGRPLPNLWERLVERSLTFTRFHLGHSDFTSAGWEEGHRAVTAAIAEGTHKVPIERVFAFDEVALMYDTLRSRTVAGKLLLSVNPSV